MNRPEDPHPFEAHPFDAHPFDPHPFDARPRGERTHDLHAAADSRSGPRSRLLVSRPPMAVQGTLALDLGDLPSLQDYGPPRTPELDPSRQSRVEHLRDAEVRGWAARFAQAVIESVTGLRPTTQLVRWTSHDVFRDLDRRARLVRRAEGPVRRPVRPQVRSVHVCRPSDDAAEVSVHVRHGHRSRALALRLERRDARWVCTALEFG